MKFEDFCEDVPDLLRPALICHYSSMVRRIEMPVHRRHRDGGYYLIHR